MPKIETDTNNTPEINTNRCFFMPIPNKVYKPKLVGYKVIVPENTTYNLGDSNNYVVSNLLPKPLTAISGSTGCQQIAIPSPYGNTPCLCQPYIKTTSSDGKNILWSLVVNSIHTSSETDSAGTKALIASAPGNGYVYIKVGGDGLCTARCGTAVPYPYFIANTNLKNTGDIIRSAETIIIVYPFF